MKRIIGERYIKGTDVTVWARRIAYFNGESVTKVPSSVRYKNLENWEEYLFLAGGLAWPALKPGFALVLAAQESTSGEKPRFKALEEVEERDVQALVRRTYELFQRYGKCRGGDPFLWYTDYNSPFNQFIRDFNLYLERVEGQAQGLTLTYPPNYFEPGCFKICCHIIYSLLQSNEKQLILGPCTRLRSYLDQIDDRAVLTGTPEEYPAVAALGYVLSALYVNKPWMQEIDVPCDEPEDYEPVPWWVEEEPPRRPYYQSTMPEDLALRKHNYMPDDEW